jgi:hypothetical protein
MKRFLAAFAVLLTTCCAVAIGSDRARADDCMGTPLDLAAVPVGDVLLPDCGGPSQCVNGLDDDGDAYVDYPNDPDCSSASDAENIWNAPPAPPPPPDGGGGGSPPPPPPGGGGGSPPPAVAACSDGRDNDGDGFVDTGDPGCTSASDNDEWHTIDGDLDIVGSAEGEVGGVLAGGNFMEKCKFVWGGVVVKHRVFGWTYFRFRLSLTFCYNQVAVTKVTNVNAISTFTRYPWVYRGLVSGPTSGAVPSVFTVESYAQGQYEACIGSNGLGCIRSYHPWVRISMTRSGQAAWIWGLG